MHDGTTDNSDDVCAGSGASVGPGALEGIRVLDVGSAVAGPWASTWLADHGADVVMVEPIAWSDPMRSTGPVSGHISGSWVQIHRSKRAIRVDLRQADGQELVRMLAKSVDVFSQNMRPGVIKRLGLDYERLRTLNPEIVYLSVSGFGPTGPYADQPVYDPIIQALSGMAESQQGDYIKSFAADKITAVTAANAVVVALLARARGKGGQEVEVNMFDATVSWLWMDCMWNESIADLPPVPTYSDWYSPYDTVDGQIAAVWVTEAQYKGAVDALGADHLLEDDRFLSRTDRVKNADAMRDVFSLEIAKWQSDELLPRLRANDVPCGKVLSRQEVASDPQLVHNETIRVQDHPDVGKVRIAKTPATLRSTPAPEPFPAPGYGQHTTEVLLQAGLVQADIDDLRARNIIA